MRSEDNPAAFATFITPSLDQWDENMDLTKIYIKH